MSDPQLIEHIIARFDALVAEHAPAEELPSHVERAGVKLADILQLVHPQLLLVLASIRGDAAFVQGIDILMTRMEALLRKRLQ